MTGPLLAAGVLALAVGTVAQIASSAQISRPLRMKLARPRRPNAVTRWAFDLISCPFCSSVWLSAAGTGIFGIRLEPGFWLLIWGCSFLAISGASMLAVLVIRKALKA